MSIYRYSVAENAVRREAKERFGVRYLLGIDSDPKTVKSNRKSDQYLTAIQYLAPHMVGGANLCTSASPGCIASCLFYAGNPAYWKNKERARLNRKRLFVEDRALFTDLLYAELRHCRARAASIGRRLAVRLNGTSDVPWERLNPGMFDAFFDVQFYDYTKHVKRMSSATGRAEPLPCNYHLTFSRSETNHADCLRVLESGHNVAAVFSTARTKALPWSYDGYDVVDGDTDDLTFQRARRNHLGHGVWVGLRAKGPARRDDSGFVIQVR